MEDPIRLRYVRCPLDIRHTNSTNPACHPFFLAYLVVSATADLVSSIHGKRCNNTHNTAFLFWEMKIFTTMLCN